MSSSQLRPRARWQRSFPSSRRRQEAVECLASGVHLEAASIKGSPPGRVQAVVTVDAPRGDGDAKDLSTENFEVREGNVRLDAEQVGLRVQRLGDAKGHQALIVVDAGRPFTDAEALPAESSRQTAARRRGHQAPAPLQAARRITV